MLGTNPWAIQQYLSSQGFETKTYTKRSTFDQVAKSADVCIMASFSLHAPGHIFMLDYEWGDYYRTIGPRAFLTMDQIMNLRFVSGSVILITVNKRT